jgi:DnaK suppressor protein
MDEKALTKRDLLHLERLLRAQRIVLTQEMDELESEATGQQGATPETQGDAALVDRDHTMDLTLLGDEAAILGEVVAAIDRLREGTYGRCEDCGRAITRARLAVIPYARRCMECETQQE